MSAFMRLLDTVKSLTKEPHRTQFIRYLVTGFTAFGIEYSLYVILYRIVGLSYILSSVIVYALVFWFVFLVNRFWSFQSKAGIGKQLIQYGLLFLFNLVVSNVFLMSFLIEVLHISPYIAPVLKMACVVCWNFLIYKFIIYKK